MDGWNRIPSRRTALRSLAAGLGLGGSCAAETPDGSGDPAGQTTYRVRVGLSTAAMAGVNVNDARAALAIWSEELMKDFEVEQASRDSLLLDSRDLLAAIREGKLDLFCLTLEEYRTVAAFVETSQMIGDLENGVALVLAARTDKGAGRLEEKRGARLVLHESPRTIMGEAWLITVLAEGGLGSPERFFSQIARTTKLSQAVLPVFFGRADVCLVARKGLQTMFEMNPQLARQVGVIRTSPQLTGCFFACHRNFPANLRRSVFARLVNAQGRPRARQVMTLFQSPGFVECGPDALRPGLALLEANDRIKMAAAGKR